MEYLEWMKQAQADLKTADNSLISKDYYASAFWSHQAIEKGLKALILKKEKRLVKIHDLLALGKISNLPEELKQKIKIFAGVYADTRYNIVDEQIPAKRFKEEDSSNLLQIAQEVLEWLRKEI